MRILSYNIHKGIGGRDRRYQLDRIIAVIDHEQPDILCLQEVDRNVKRSHHDDQPRLLAEHFQALGSLFQFNHRVKSGGYGNLVLSRWEFLETHLISLRYKWRKNRGAQMVTIATPNGPLFVVNWHLGLAEHERQWQVSHVLEHRQFRRSLTTPTIVIGDTNDWRNTLGKKQFSRRGLHHVTEPAKRFRSFPALIEVASLDKAFVSERVQVEQARIVKSPLARRASDHLPLVIDFSI